MSRRAISPDGIAPPRAHYSHAVEAGGMLYVSGQLPLHADGGIVAGEAEAQTRSVLDNLRRVVEEAGATLDDVVKLTVYILDRADREAVVPVMREYFADPPPAAALVVVSSLAHPGFLIEVEAIAELPSRS